MTGGLVFKILFFLWTLCKYLKDLIDLLKKLLDAQELAIYLMALVFKLLWRGKCHLETILASHLFVEHYVSKKVGSWSHCAAKLSDIAKVHPHAAYAAFLQLVLQISYSQ